MVDGMSSSFGLEFTFLGLTRTALTKRVGEVALESTLDAAITRVASEALIFHIKGEPGGMGRESTYPGLADPTLIARLRRSRSLPSLATRFQLNQFRRYRRLDHLQLASVSIHIVVKSVRKDDGQRSGSHRRWYYHIGRHGVVESGDIEKGCVREHRVDGGHW